jgi:hypothetical protein
MTPETMALITDIKKVFANTSEQELRSLVNRIALQAADPDLRESFRSLLPSDKYDDAYYKNVLAAGMFAVLPGSKYMTLEESPGPKVNRFLHRLRKALLACQPLQSKLRENASKYMFYPEFLTFSLMPIRARIVAMAHAHAGMKPGNDELTPLYSLGGFFPFAEAEKAVDVVDAGGTTCIMTARALYHAAGLRMIGQRLPTVGTPAGSIELGLPVVQVQNTYRNGRPAKMTGDVATVERDDMEEFKGGFNDLQGPEPNLQIGDIYMIGGHGPHKFLLRGKGALAVHVGIIVKKEGRELSSVDGGSGGGARIDHNQRRFLHHKAGVGWTFGDSRAYSAIENADVERYMADYADPEAVVAWMKSRPSEKANYDYYIKTRKNYDDAVAKNQEKLAKILRAPVNMAIDAARRRIRLGVGGKFGEVRTIKGWWKPEAYPELRYAGYDSVRTWLT